MLASGRSTLKKKIGRPYPQHIDVVVGMLQRKKHSNLNDESKMRHYSKLKSGKFAFPHQKSTTSQQSTKLTGNQPPTDLRLRN